MSGWVSVNCRPVSRGWETGCPVCCECGQSRALGSGEVVLDEAAETLGFRESST